MKVFDVNYKCKLCGSPLYRTDSGGRKVILQCSSNEAMFWSFNRGTKEQSQSHKHFTESIIEIDINEWDKLEKV